ncbi:MAG: Ig domain-containing protein [Verrucomicrobiota bacterium]
MSAVELEDPTLSGTTAFAQWDAFTEASGGSNDPDVGTSGFSGTPSLQQTDPNSFAFITSSKNIYSFAGVTSFAIEADFSGTMNNLALQFLTAGNEMDYNSIALNYGSGFSNTLAAPTGFFTQTGEADGPFGGITRAYLTQWDLSAIGGITGPFQITFSASGTSASLQEARIDASNVFNALTPPPPVIENEDSVIAYTGSAFELQIVASGDPFLYTESGLSAIGLSINSATGSISGTVSSGISGNFPVTIRATNGEFSDPFVITFVVVTETTYSAYMSSRSITGPDAVATVDLDKDGMTNLEEYYHGTEPNISDFTNSRRKAQFIDLPGGPDSFVYSFNWNVQATDVSAELQLDDGSLTFGSNDLVGSISYATDGTANASVIAEETTVGFLRLSLSLDP